MGPSAGGGEGLAKDCTATSKSDYKGVQAAIRPHTRIGGGTMKYAIWFVRFWYAGWMIPAGIEHFYHMLSIILYGICYTPVR